MRALLVVTAGLALAACWRGPAPAPSPVVGNQAIEQQPATELAGAYWCTITDDGYEYDRQPCVIRRVQGRSVLAKLGGSQRVRGFVTPDRSGGFRFEGELFCPWGDCTQALSGQFQRTGEGFQSTLSAGMTLRLTRTSTAAFGGASYGGDGYGDPFGYAGTPVDGGGYGGAAYGVGF